jgi:hypothetical protein
MTTRKLMAALLAGALGAGSLGLMGCATSGQLHVYRVSTAEPAVVHDAAEGLAAAEVPAFLEPGETITGFAYDPFTDHFFLRLAPGDRLKVIDRPARAVKREFAAEHTPSTGGGDLAVRPRDGHLFLTHPSEAALIELNRFGNFVRTVPLATLARHPAGVAFDSIRDRLLVLASVTELRVTAHSLDGQLLATITLDRPIAAGALGYDAELRELYAPLRDGDAIGVFAEDGRLRRTLPLAADFLDVGPRSFLRMF